MPAAMMIKREIETAIGESPNRLCGKIVLGKAAGAEVWVATVQILLMLPRDSYIQSDPGVRYLQ